MDVLDALGVLCCELRETAGLDYVDIGQHLPRGKGRDRTSLKKFEDGSTRPRNLDRTIAAYAEATNTTAEAIWREALKRAEASRVAELGQEQPPDQQHSPPKGRRSGRGGRAKGRPPKR